MCVLIILTFLLFGLIAVKYMNIYKAHLCTFCLVHSEYYTGKIATCEFHVKLVSHENFLVKFTCGNFTCDTHGVNDDIMGSLVLWN